MRWCRFQNKDAASFGIIEGDEVVAVAGSPFAEYQRTDERHPLSSVQLLVPVIPPTFYAAGLNYREHVIESAAKRGEEPKFPPNADIGYRANNALCANGENIVIPKDASEVVQYEGELVAVIGKQCKHVSEAEALDYVFGYTIGNDVSERKWQHGDRTLWRGKNTDTFKPMGPWIETDVDLVQPIGLGTAFGVLGPVLDLGARWPAVAAAGKLPEPVETHRSRLHAQRQAADLAALGGDLR